MFIYKKNMLLAGSGQTNSTRGEEVSVFAFSSVKSI